MFPKFDFIRHFAEEAARLFWFHIELDVDITEEELLEELGIRG